MNSPSFFGLKKERECKQRSYGGDYDPSLYDDIIGYVRNNMLQYDI